MKKYFAELLGTFILVFVILSVTKTSFAASMVIVLIIGFTVTLWILAEANLSEASLNPARLIGPGIFAGGATLQEL